VLIFTHEDAGFAVCKKLAGEQENEDESRGCEKGEKECKSKRVDIGGQTPDGCKTAVPPTTARKHLPPFSPSHLVSDRKKQGVRNVVNFRWDILFLLVSRFSAILLAPSLFFFLRGGLIARCAAEINQ
jgi:hypothetical protein